MPSCVLRRCKNYGSKANKNEGVTYHAFPRDDSTRLKWVSIIQAERSECDWMPTRSSTICSAHFKQEDKYTSSKGYIRLKRTAVPFITTASTSTTSSQQRVARKKRKGPLPEAKIIIKSVFNYLQTEYENLKTYTGGSFDLSPLENILGRTAAATGISEEVVTAVLEEEDSDDSSHDSSKRARVSHDYYDENISPIEEESSGESADEAQPDIIESTVNTEENSIETLKVEIDDNAEYYSKPNPRILFQIPSSREQMSVLHQSLSLTEPTPAEVKQEPADVEEQQSTSAVHHLLQSNFGETSNT